MPFIPLIGGQSIHLKLLQDPPDARAADMDIMVTLEIDHDLPGSKMVCLPEIDYFGYDIRLGYSRAVLRSPGTVKEPFLPVFLISFQPPIVGGPADPKVSTGFRDIMGHFLEVTDDAQPPSLVPQRIVVNHKASPSLNAISLSKRALGVNNVCQF